MTLLEMVQLFCFYGVYKLIEGIITGVWTEFLMWKRDTDAAMSVTGCSRKVASRARHMYYEATGVDPTDSRKSFARMMYPPRIGSDDPYAGILYVHEAEKLEEPTPSQGET